ncbi:MAG: hypothetical protein KDK12_10440 [Rhodobacteraceae bacterium]|nr:hypothetical protein [Paracoccaceae bacterium]
MNRRLTFRHAFVEEETPDVALDLTLTRRAPGILAFERPGLPAGYGYATAGTLGCTIPVPGNAVQVACHLTEGGMLVTGTAQRNAAGRFIMWEERLTRA